MYNVKACSIEAVALFALPPVLVLDVTTRLAQELASKLFGCGMHLFHCPMGLDSLVLTRMVTKSVERLISLILAPEANRFDFSPQCGEFGLEVIARLFQDSFGFHLIVWNPISAKLAPRLSLYLAKAYRKFVLFLAPKSYRVSIDIYTRCEE